jgi:hypothetical protein
MDHSTNMELEFFHTSTRILRYQKQDGRRGRGLVLSNLIIQLARHTYFRDFSKELTTAARTIARFSALDSNREKAAVIDAMRTLATTIDEIAEQADLPTATVRSVLSVLEKEGSINRKQRSVEPRHLFFLRDMEEADRS